VNLALINIKQLLTVAEHGNRVKTGKDMQNLCIIENAAVIVEDETISWCGKMNELSMSSIKEADVVDCKENVVMPGFVDSHTHLLFGGGRENEFAMRSAGATYQEIAAKGGGILSTVTHTRNTEKKDLKKIARQRLNRLLQHGTTTVEIKSGYGLDMQNEIKMLEAITELGKEEVISVVPTFLGAHAVPPEYNTNKDSFVNELIGKMIPYIGKKMLARFCDVFCEEGYFKPVLSMVCKRSFTAMSFHPAQVRS
jgi:imidazolonepropionase